MVFSSDEEIKIKDYYLNIEDSELILGVEYEYEYEAEYPISLIHWFFFSKPLQWGLLWINMKEAEKEAFVTFLKKLYGVD